jgi:hypothetical protein
LRSLPLQVRKRELRRLIPDQPSALLYADHIEQYGEELFHLACREDLEGMVAKLRNGTYDCQYGTSWIKIKNPGYTQIVGRQELFEKKTAAGKPSTKARIQFCGHVNVNPFCQIEYSSSGKADGMPCGKPAVAECSDCGAAICSDCRSWCCGDSFCEYCYDYHGTHSCVKKPVQNERTQSTAFRSFPKQG